MSELLSSSITVECLAEGSPDPWYVWTNVADGTETRGGNLTIENVNDLNGRNYTYTCTATNDLGNDKRTVSIEITSTYHHFDVIMKIYRKIPKISPSMYIPSKYKPPQTGNAKDPPLNRPSKYKPPGGLYLENCHQIQSITKQKR